MEKVISVNNREKVKLFTREEHAEIVVTNQVQNVFDVEVLQDLISGFSMLEPGIKFVLLRSGESNFSTGFDTSCVKVKEPAFMKEIQDLAFVLRRMIESIDRPVYAMVQGYCLGLGFEIVLACDHIYADETAKFGFPDSKFGMPPLSGILERVSTEYGKPLVDLFFTGEIIGIDDPLTRIFATVLKKGNFVNAALSEIEELDNGMRSYYKGLRKMDAGNPDNHIFSILDPERIRLKELEAFRNNL